MESQMLLTKTDEKEEKRLYTISDEQLRRVFIYVLQDIVRNPSNSHLDYKTFPSTCHQEEACMKTCQDEGCKNLATLQCGKCKKDFCDSHARRQPRNYNMIKCDECELECCTIS
jgi:hypothetical protein